MLQSEDLSLDPRQDQSAASMKGLSLRTRGKLGAELTRHGRGVTDQPLPLSFPDLWGMGDAKTQDPL